MDNNLDIKTFQWDIDIDGIIFVGDIHGEYGVILELCNRTSRKAIICCGDCGMGFAEPGYYTDQFKKMERRLEKTDNWLVFIRGNHDDPIYFDGVVVSGDKSGWAPDEHPRIHMASRGWEFLRLMGKDLNACVMCGGGAVSVDRTMRLEGKSWWPDEGVARADPQKLAAATVEAVEGIGSLCIATHSSPSLAMPLENKAILTGWASVDRYIVDDCRDEREYLTDVARAVCSSPVPVDGWWYGHFHKSYRGVIGEEPDENECGIPWRCKYFGLAINENYSWPAVRDEDE